MGLSIHYSGRIADKRKLHKLIEEVQEIATVHGWKSKIYEREFPDAFNQGVTSSNLLIDNLFTSGTLNKKNENHDGKLYGIDFTPEGSEPVSIAFLSNGRMSSFMQLYCWGEFREERQISLRNVTVSEQNEVEIHNDELTLTADQYDRYLHLCSTKTQYAGPQAHEMIIGVFRYVAKTYLIDFNMVDEAQFWETGDKELLLKNFERYNSLLNGFKSTLTENTKRADEDMDSYLIRLIREFRGRADGRKPIF